MSEHDGGENRNRAKQHRGSVDPQTGSRQLQRLLGNASSAVGTLIGVSSIVLTVFGQSAAMADVSAEVVAIVLGVLGYLLGSRRIALTAIAVGVLALVFGLAATQGLIPGAEPTDRGLPPRETGTG